jgi:hypothetical protein
MHLKYYQIPAECVIQNLKGALATIFTKQIICFGNWLIALK